MRGTYASNMTFHMAVNLDGTQSREVAYVGYHKNERWILDLEL